MEKKFTIELTNNQGYFLKTFMGGMSNSMYKEIINKYMAGNASLLQLLSGDKAFDVDCDEDITFSIWQKLDQIKFNSPSKLIIKYQYAYICSDNNDGVWKITEPLSDNELSNVSSWKPTYNYIKILETKIKEYK